jgi:hypothetical protein
MDDDGIQRDSLHKIHPLLNIVKMTIGKYANHGSELSLDEATMANKSSYRCFLICFNPSKPTGKFHFKIYMVCCAESNLMFCMKINTKDNADVDNTEEEYDEVINKLDNLTLQLCTPFYNSGCTINMDNYYLSTTCAMKLHEKGVFCHGTIRSHCKCVPKSILFNATEARTLPRGSHKIAVNKRHQMLAVGWVDNMTIGSVMRKVGKEKIEVNAPLAIANYNKYMGGMDHHDRL